jgi:alpha-L-arabinofuranosidase
MKSLLFALLMSSLLLAAPGNDSVSIDVNRVLANVSSNPLGINTDYFVDDDANRTPLRPLDQALAGMRVKYLRYPGGEKSDGYLWSVPPYDHPQPTLARWATGDWPQNQEWPSYDRTLVQSDGRTLVKDPLDFDEFMRLTRTVNGEPVLVVAYDSWSKPAQSNGSAPSKDQLLENARQWVRYANVTKGYGVKYWEIGNESYLPGYNSNYISPDTYAQDVITFSQAMKSIDPSIKILANGNDPDWWRIVLTEAGSAIDLLSVHSYPASGWGSYDYYRTNNVDLMSAIHVAEQAIDAYAPPDDAARIRIAVTEVNSMDWSGAWPHDNNIGHAVVLFDSLGQELCDPRIEFSQVWTTRWVTGDSQTSPSLWDALDKYNNLQATGRAMAIWGQFLLDEMVATSGTDMVEAYASHSHDSLNVFLINKDTSARTTNVSIAGFGAQTAVDRWTFEGSGAYDLFPVFRHADPIATDGTHLSLTLDPVSITVLQLHVQAGSGGPYLGIPFSIPGTINAKDFDNGGEGVGYHDTTAGNYGGAYRNTDVDVQTSPGAGNDTVGWIDTGEWLSYSVQVAQGGTYTVAATAASIYSGKSFHLELNGNNVTGSIVVPNTQGWDTWTTVTAQGVNLNAGAQQLKFVAESDSFNLSKFDIEPAAGPPPVSSRLLYETFEDQSSSNWTPTAGSWVVCRPFPTASWEYCGTTATENVSLAGSTSWRDYYVESYINLTDDSWSGGAILGRVQDSTHYYQAELRRDFSGSKTWTLWKNSGGTWTYINSGYYDYAAGQYYRLRLSLVGSSINVYVSTDWGVSFQWLGGGSDTEFASGAIGVRSWGSPASFDYVDVWSQ